MTSRQEAKLSMYNAVSTYCANNASVTASVLAFQSAVTEFDNVVALIRNASQVETNAISGITEDKANLKEALCITAASVASSIFAYAVTINNAELKQQVNYPLSTLQYLRDELLAGTCRNIVGAGTANLAALVDYGITQPKLDDFIDQIEDYEDAVPEPRNAVSNRAAQSAAISSYMKDADAILKYRMDKLALQFRATNMNFYNNYRNNRVIVDPGSSSTQLVGAVKQTSSDIIVAGATIQVVELNLTATTNALGLYAIPVTDPGLYTVTFNAEGYEEKTVTAVQVKLGKTTNLDAELALLPR